MFHKIHYIHQQIFTEFCNIGGSSKNKFGERNFFQISVQIKVIQFEKMFCFDYKIEVIIFSTKENLNHNTYLKNRKTTIS